MSQYNSRQYSDFRGINLRAGNGVLRFETPDQTPTSTSGERILYVNSSNQLVYNDGSSDTVVGAAGAFGGSLDTAYDNGRVITANVGGVVVNGVSEATAVLALNGDGGTTGALLGFTHTTDTRLDVAGTGSTWSVTGQGAAEFQASVTTVAIVGYNAGADGNLTIDAKGTGTITIGATSTGAVTITRALTATASLTITGTGGSNVLTVTAGDLVASDGSLSLTDADNATSLIVTNNTATTVGAAGNNGVVRFVSDSLTTGVMVNISLAEGTLNGGFYLSCRDSTAGANVFTVAEDGALTIAGVGGSNVLTITAGDMLMSDGSITLVDADNAVSLSVTNSTATTASIVAIVGAGVFTGSTTGSFVTITPSGLTSGTALYLPVAALDTGRAVHIVANALTSGIVFNVTSSATAITGAGRLFLSTHSGATGTSAVLNEFITSATDETVLLRLSTAAMVDGVNLSIVGTTGMTTGSLIRATTSTAGAVATNGIVAIVASGAFTSTSNVGILDVSATATTAGTLVHLTSTAAGQTATQLLNITSSGYTTGYTGNTVQITGCSTTGASNTVALIGVNTTAGNVLSVANNALTLGSGTAVRVSHTTSVLGAGTSLVRISSTSVDTGTTTGVLLDLSTTSAAGSTQILLTDSSADTAARIGIYSSVTNVAAVLAKPFQSSNVAVTGTGSKFTKHFVMTDGTKTCQIWMSQDNTTPNGNLTGLKGDICLNGTGGATFYCSADGTSWSTMG